MTRNRLAVAALALLLGACAGDERSDRTAGGSSEPGAGITKEAPPVQPPRTPAWEPGPGEQFPNGKRLAARIAQRALTYARGSRPQDVAAALGPPSRGTAERARVLRHAVHAGSRSWAEVVYPQLSGVTATSLGAMVVVRQTVERVDGRRRRITRVVDVRLRRTDGPWSLDAIGSVGGRPVARPAQLSAMQRQVLDHPNIELPNTARWDILRGGVDPSLLAALAAAAERHRLAIAVVDSGHPRNVWATTRRSGHAAGLAADIWAVDGRPVIEQRAPGSGAYALAERLLAGGAFQLGSPWVLGGGAPRSFTDAVHQDHLHLQQSAGG